MTPENLEHSSSQDPTSQVGSPMAIYQASMGLFNGTGKTLLRAETKLGYQSRWGDGKEPPLSIAPDKGWNLPVVVVDSSYDRAECSLTYRHDDGTTFTAHVDVPSTLDNTCSAKTSNPSIYDASCAVDKRGNRVHGDWRFSRK